MIAASFSFFFAAMFASKAMRAVSCAWWSEAIVWSIVAAVAIVFGAIKVMF